MESKQIDTYVRCKIEQQNVQTGWVWVDSQGEEHWILFGPDRPKQFDFLIKADDEMHVIAVERDPQMTLQDFLARYGKPGDIHAHAKVTYRTLT